MSHTDVAKWPGWETVKLIGRGSFGAVYEIQRDVLGEIEKAALKVITIPQNASDIEDMYSEGYDEESITSTFQSHLKSIVAEYSLMRKMSGSANIVNCDDVYYVRHANGIGWDIFIKMELLTPLPKALTADIPEKTVLDIARDMCAALVLCNTHDIVHRDIKPQNIFMSSHGDYKLGDFGIAKTVEKTMGGTKIGTYKYMAPEVYNNQPYGHGADIYSLGLVLYWLLNERRIPFLPLPPVKLGVGMEEMAKQRRFAGEALPPPKNGSEALKTIVLKACAFDPKDRYQNAQEMLEALERIGGVAVGKDEAIGADEEPADEADFEEQEEVAGVIEVEETDAAVDDVSEKPEEVSAQVSEEKKARWLRPALAVGAAILAVVLLVCFLGGRGGPGTPTTEPAGAEHSHSWTAADCDTPKTCSKCGATEGTAIGHSWVVADCVTPQTCSACGTAEGTARGHAWVEFSSGEGRECSDCSVVQYYCKINVTDVTMKLGESFSLKLTDPNGVPVEAQWVSNNNRVLISGNSITAASPGNTWVTAVYEDYTYSCMVRVVLTTPVAPQTLDADVFCTVGLKTDGTVEMAGSYTNYVSHWTDIVSVSASMYHTAGLRDDGTVVAEGNNSNGQLDVSGWKSMVAISAGTRYTVGLKADGTVLAVGDNAYGQCDVSAWTDIIAVSAGDSHTLGLRADGTVVAAGNNGYGQCDVSAWTDIVAISAGYNHTVGLKADGTVVAVGKKDDGQCNVDDWTDIIAISAGVIHTVGLKADGTVVAEGSNGYGQRNVGKWTHIVAISAGSAHTVGLRHDGTVVVVGDEDFVQSGIKNWKNIQKPSEPVFHLYTQYGELSASAVTIRIKESLTFSLKNKFGVELTQNVTFSVSDESVLAVDAQGHVTGVTSGAAYVYVTYKGEVVYRCLIYVKNS